jgi:hypothetical protein
VAFQPVDSFAYARELEAAENPEGQAAYRLIRLDRESDSQ